MTPSIYRCYLSALQISYHARSVIGQQNEDIHWLSIINSFVLVMLLTAFLSIVLIRVLNKDLSQYIEVSSRCYLVRVYWVTEYRGAFLRAVLRAGFCGGTRGDRGVRMEAAARRRLPTAGEQHVLHCPAGLWCSTARYGGWSAAALAGQYAAASPRSQMSPHLLPAAQIGTFYPGNRGAIYTAAVVLYALTAGVRITSCETI